MVQLWFCWGFTVRRKWCNFDHFLVPKSVTSCQGWRETSCDWAPLPMPLYWPSKHSLNVPALEVPGQFDHSQICTVGREGVLRSGPSSWSSQQRAAPACVSVITHTQRSPLTVITHRSAATLKPLTGGVNDIDHLVALMCSAGWTFSLHTHQPVRTLRDLYASYRNIWWNNKTFLLHRPTKPRCRCCC